jgi:dolichol-phosphate mannosyltransferase
MEGGFLLSIVVPCMNEAGNIERLVEAIDTAVNNKFRYEIIFVDDGSNDETLNVIKKNKALKYISFSRNFGHQAALRAGLEHAAGDCVITMDGDLQHPPELIPVLVEKWKDEHADIVFTIRKDDKKVGFFKRITSRLFYKFMNSMAGLDMVAGSADFRLMDRKVVNIIRKLKENPIFFRGMVRWLGFKQIGIEYMPNERFWGASKYSVVKMFNFAIDGITGFSIKPLYISVYLGFILSVLSILYGIYIVFEKLVLQKDTPGFATLVVLITFIGGMQLIMLGIIGIYIGKSFLEGKDRPPYLIKETNLCPAE